MQDSKRWQELCEQAAVEHDNEKLMQLIDKINRMLKEEQRQQDEGMEYDA